MNFLTKLLIANTVIILCTQIGKKLPLLAGLIATMPLTGLIVMIWLYSDHPGDYRLMTDYTKGVLWGFAPSLSFFLVAALCFRNALPLSTVLLASFGVWLAGAILHQWLLK